MSSSEHSPSAATAGPVVDMSCEAISRRIRLVSELNQLGLSLAKAKPYPAPKVPVDGVFQQANSENATE